LASQVRKKSLRYLAAKVGVPHAEGIPVLVFNPLAWQRSEIAVAELVVTERFHDVTLFDGQGKEIPAQVVRAKDFGPDFHIWVQFLAKDLPSLGYQCYRLRLNPGPGKVSVSEWGHFSPEPATLPAPIKSPFKRIGLKIRGPYYEVEFDAEDGSIKSLKPILGKGGKKTGKNIFGRGGANRLGIYMEKPHPMSAWTLDPYAEGPLPMKSLGKVEIQQEGPESLTLRAQLGWGRSRFWLSTTLHAESPRIDCSLKVDWLETGSESVPGPMLRALWQLASTPKSLTCDVPYGVLEREPGREVAAQKWVDVAVPGGGLALFNRGKYGHSLEKDSLRLSLLRSSYDPDPYPDLGQHTIEWALQFHPGNARQAGLARLGLGYNVPLECYQARTQKGSLPQRHSFFALDSDADFVPTGLKKSEKGNGIVLRGYDAGGKGCKVQLPQAAQELDLLEAPLSSGKKKAVKLKPWGIVSLRMD
ncbi:MAG: glycoside hydrolase family 38 C-terminal domain-containing protein, partial [candidate division FCPU426 bacterium]